MKQDKNFREIVIGIIWVSCFIMIITVAETSWTGCASTSSLNASMNGSQKKDMDYDHVDKKQFGDSWNRQVEEFHKDNLNQKPGGIVMVGDSITHGFPSKELFPDIPIIKRGISGDRVIGVIARQNESIYELKPDKIFLLIGSNDAGLFPEMGMDKFYAQYDYLFKNIKNHCPQCKVFIQSVLPIRGKYAFANSRILEINKIQKKLSKQFGFYYIDLHAHFSDKKGEMKEEYSEDGVHPNMAGNKLWKNILEPYMKEKRT